MSYLVMALITIGLAVVLAWVVDTLRRQQAAGQVRATQETADRVLAEARTEAEAIRKEAEIQGKESVIQAMVDEARHEAAKHIRLVEQEAREEADRQAKKIVSIAIERLAGEFVAERTVSVVHLPSDDLKGRIIGREGRNIRALEAATGVDLIIDDTPEAVVVSCFNPVRRETPS